MKAILFTGVGKSEYREVDPGELYFPTAEEQEKHGVTVIARQFEEPGEGEIEVEAIAGAVCTHEASIFTGELTVPYFPMIPGHEAVHRVIRVGKGVKGFKEGDLVSCCWYMGQWSKRITGPAELVYHLPEKVNDPACWMVEPVASIVNAVTYFDIKPGDRVLVIGAGFMGLLMVQMLSHYPLGDLVVVEIKKFNCDLAKKCGATEVVNISDSNKFNRADYIRQNLYDIVVECSGTQDGLNTAIELCNMAGSIYLFGWHRKPRMIDLKLGHLRGQKIIHTSPALDSGKPYERHWPIAIRLMEIGVFDLKPLITHRYKAEDIQTAMKETASKQGNFIKSVILF